MVLQRRRAIDADASPDAAMIPFPIGLDGRPRRRHGERVMQQTLVGCAFCDAPSVTETGEAHTWGQDVRITHPICVDCAIQTRPDPGFATKEAQSLRDELRKRPQPDLPCPECPNDDIVLGQKSADGAKVQRWFECRDCGYESRSAIVYAAER